MLGKRLIMGSSLCDWLFYFRRLLCKFLFIADVYNRYIISINATLFCRLHSYTKLCKFHMASHCIVYVLLLPILPHYSNVCPPFNDRKYHIFLLYYNNVVIVATYPFVNCVVSPIFFNLRS